MYYWENQIDIKSTHHRGTEGTEKEFLVLACSHAPAWEQDIQAKNKKLFSVPSVPLW